MHLWYRRLFRVTLALTCLALGVTLADQEMARAVAPSPERDGISQASEATEPEDAETASEESDMVTDAIAEANPDLEADSTADADAVKPRPEPRYYEPEGIAEPVEGTAKVYVVSIEGVIDTPQLFILRRALKEAIAGDIDTVVLDIDTPGGRLDVMLEMMEALVERFEGTTVAYVNPEAISAGAFISVACKRIYFAPDGLMGAAAAVSGTGEEIPATMRAKLDSYLQGKIRVLTEDNGRYRSDVIRAMSDLDYEFTIGDEVITAEGELLSITAKEAIRLFNEPGQTPEPLLASGIAEDIDDLLTMLHGAGNYEVVTFEISWAEKLAKWFAGIAPLIITAGFLMVFIEFKTPSFGIIGGIGIGLVVLGFTGSNIAGLAGYEALALFGLGLILLLIEIFFLPGVGVFFILGLLSVFGAMVWSLVDIWPTTTGGVSINLDSLWGALGNAIIGMFLVAIGAIALLKYLPKSAYAHIIHSGHSPRLHPVDAAGGNSRSGARHIPEIGIEALVTRTLRPLGEIEVEGSRFEARAVHGTIDAGETVEVVGRESFALMVKRKEDA